uniref:Uncharacterized protein n=1 Tax=Anguilla anguilla TaxID=7936 RepID=A0A0E9U814_ANGAN
MQQNKCSTS